MARIEGIETIGDIVRHHGRLHPHKIALIFQGERIDYQSLDARSNQIAHALLAAGIKPGQRIAHFGKNSADYFALVFAAAKIGAVLVGINWRLSPAEARYILIDSESRLLFSDRDMPPLLEADDQADNEPCRSILIGAGDESGLMAFYRPHAKSDPQIAVDDDAVLYQMYTSGTTGHPKGAEITHKGVLLPRQMDDLIDAREWHRWTGDEVQLVQAPVFHLTGNVWAMIGLYVGATLVVHRDFDMDRIFDDIEREKISHAIFVPAMLMAMVQHPRAKTTDYQSLVAIYYGASPIPLDLLRHALSLFQSDFIQLYGMTEISGSATYLPAADHDPSGDNPRMRSAGKPFPWARIKIIDELGQSLPPHQVGEVLIKTDTVMRGYWKRPDATQAVLSDGWFHTGDAGLLDEDGYLYIHDRIKDMIISGGENIYPAEVESCLFAHPGIRDVAVIGVPSPQWGEAVKAIVVSDDPSLEAEDVIAFARAQIAGFKCPRSVDFITALPRNASGKILKRDLRAPYWDQQDRQVN
ncbi:long-chain-fatty-acid--CoA ligase FadD13 [alpha proteobacterium Q-1]|nr:long-chain-fatty-acid--CoA ligase FadD13 [alpha proteobacterium Q-1]